MHAASAGHEARRRTAAWSPATSLQRSARPVVAVRPAAGDCLGPDGKTRTFVDFRCHKPYDQKQSEQEHQMTTPHAERPLIPDEIARAVVLPDGYAELYKTVLPAFQWLRTNLPIGVAEVEGYDPVWVVSKHAHVQEVLLNAKKFHSADLNIMLHPK